MASSSGSHVRRIENGRTVVLSDLHLGHVSTNLAGARRLQRAVGTADTLLLNGDSFEGRRGQPEAETGRHEGELAELAGRSGGEAVFLTGNHDPHVSHEHAATLWDGTVLVMHGDAVFPSICPWGKESGKYAASHRDLVAKAGGEGAMTLDRRLLIARQVSETLPIHLWVAGERKSGAFVSILKRSMSPHKILAILHSWITGPARVASFARHYAPTARLAIVGHTHRPGIRRIGGTTVVNTGGFLPGGKAYAVELLDGAYEVFEVTGNPQDGYARGRIHAMGGVSECA